MTNTDVTLISNGGIFVPSIDSVHVVSGDTISFSTADGSSAFAFFSLDAISALSPQPTSPFAIASGKKAEFTFTTSSPGAYSAYFAQDAGSAPTRFASESSDMLRLEVVRVVVPPGFPGPGDTVGSGHGG